MNKFIFDNKQINELDNLESVATSSTLLIPEFYLAELEERIEDHGSLKNYVEYLLKEYEVFLKTKILPESQELKTIYQAKDLNLQRKDFRPNPKDWLRLKLYRVGLNYSISYLFVFLLRLDLLGLARVLKPFLKFVGAPFPESIFQNGGIFINTKKSEYGRIYQYY